MAKSNKVIICAALTGAVTPKEKSPNHPITPDEIAADVVRCAKAGAAAVHLHARDINAKGTMSTDVFTEIFEKTKAACQEAGVDVIINLTTSGAMNCTKEERVAHIQKLKPEMMSYDVGSFNWDDAFIYDNSPDFLRLAGKVALECDVKPEIEVFDSGHIRSTQTYIKEGLLKAPAHYQFVLGVGGAMEGTIDNVVFLRNMLPEGATWSATGIGTAHMPVMYAAQAAGKFKPEIIPITVEIDGKEVVVTEDEGIRPGTTLEGLAKLKPCFKPDGVVTAATSSQMTDGASFLVLMAREVAEKLGYKPIAKFVGFAVGGVPAGLMGLGPIKAVPKVMAKTGLTVDDMDVIELNEAFAAQALACIRDLKFPYERVNPNGGAMALGHPMGATGAFLSCKAFSELQRTGGKYALITMCIGGGQGAAGIYEME